MLKVFVRLLALVPFSILYLFVDVVSPVLMAFYRRKVVFGNLRSAYPDHSRKEIAAIASGFYRNLLEVTVEVIKSARLNETELERRVHFIKDETYEKMLAAEKGSLILTTHQGNWEWLALQGGKELHEVVLVYKPLKNQPANRLMYWLRSRLGNRPVATNEIRTILKDAHRGSYVAVVADQSPTRRNNAKIWTKFLGIETAFYQGIFNLPYLLQTPVYFAALKRVRRGHYEVRFTHIAQPPYVRGDVSILKRYVEVAEREIYNHPGAWLWSHNRWKYSRTPDEELV